MSTKSPDPVPPNTFLRGGPPHGPGDRARLCHVEDSAVRLKLDRGNCYDHFEATPDRVRLEGYELRVFDWTHRTYVAE